MLGAEIAEVQVPYLGLQTRNSTHIINLRIEKKLPQIGQELRAILPKLTLLKILEGSH